MTFIHIRLSSCLAVAVLKETALRIPFITEGHQETE